MIARRLFAATALAFISWSGLAFEASAGQKLDVSDPALVKKLPGFSNAYTTVNGIRIHYVVGGEGRPLVLLPGWPETWWGYHKVMPELAKHFRVIAVDMRGQGSSGKPAGGFDKKTMASDVSALVKQLGFKSVDIIGHDIGSMVAFSFAENHPDQTDKLVMLDVTHPSAGMLKIPLLPTPGSFNDQTDEDHIYLWWFAFHQVKGLPEKILAGREYLEQEWFFHYMAKNEAAIDTTDKAVYAAAYASPDAIRASNGWYQAFGQDVADDANYGKLSMPVLGIGGVGYKRLKAALDDRAPGSQTFRVEGSGHFIAEEQPEEMLHYLADFLK